MILRYVDDSRALFQPIIKAGWRMVEGRLKFRKSLEEEDNDILG